MQGIIDLKAAMAAFQKITTKGQKIDSEYKLGELLAGSDHDGYTIYITDKTVTLTIMFHNRYRLDYKRKMELDLFLERLQHIQQRF